MTQTDTLRCACAQIEHRIDAPELMLKAHEEAIADAIDQSVDFLQDLQKSDLLACYLADDAREATKEAALK